MGNIVEETSKAFPDLIYREIPMLLEQFAPVAFYRDVVVMKDGKLIGNAGDRMSGSCMSITGADRIDYLCDYKIAVKTVGPLIHKAFYIDITGIPDGERIVKDTTVPAWLSEFAA